jgi:hypothetical protein
MDISRWIRAGMGCEMKGLLSSAKVDKTLARQLGGTIIERYY